MQNRLSVASHEITLFTGISTRYLFENSILSAMFLFKILVFVSINWFWFFKILLDSVKITTLMHFPHWSLQTPSLHPPEKIRKPIVLYIFTGSQKKKHWRKCVFIKGIKVQSSSSAAKALEKTHSNRQLPLWRATSILMNKLFHGSGYSIA